MKKSLRIALSLLLCLLSVGVIGAPRSAWSIQDAEVTYLSDPVPPQFNLADLDPKVDRNKVSEVRRVRGEFESKVTSALGSANALSGADQQSVGNWVGQVLMAEMTTLNLDAQAKLGESRQEFFRKIVRTTADNNRAFLLNIIVPKAMDIASKNYHPAARINAVLILGLLDAQEGISGQRPPKPHLAALRELLKIVDDPQSPEYLVAAALSGVQRHAEIDGQMPDRERLRPDVRTMIVDSMLRLMAKYDANQVEDQPGYLLSRRAVQTLDGLSLAAADPKTSDVKAALTGVATKQTAGKWLRLDAFLALSRLPIDDPKVYLDNLGRLVVYVAKDSRNQVLLAQKMVKIDQMIKEKTSLAQAKKKTTGTRRGPTSLGTGGGQAQGLGAEDRDSGPMPGNPMGGMGNGMAGLDDFTEDGLFPYHLHYARTNVKIVVAGSRSILGTASRTATGLKAAYASNPETLRLIDQLEKELKALLATTDIGFVEEKPMTQAEIRTRPAEAEMREQPNSVRVLAGMGRAAEALEKIVGVVEMPKVEPQLPLPASTPVGTDAPSTVPANDTATTTEESTATAGDENAGTVENQTENQTEVGGSEAGSGGEGGETTEGNGGNGGR